MVDLSVVIVNYNVSYFLEQTLRSVATAIQNLNVEIFVVDNNSIDNSVAMVKAKFPWVTLIANTQNVGFSKANNQAIRQATGRYILLLNPDTVVQEDTFIKCTNYMDAHTDVGALGVYMVDGNGNFLPESKRGLPTPWVALCKITGLSALFRTSKLFGQYHLGYLDKNQTHAVSVLSGAFMFIRKDALNNAGLLDEDYFMYGEDIDLSYRITKAGYKNVYFSDTRIIHYKGESTKKSSINYVFVFYNAMIIFAAKHFSKKYAGILTVLIRLAIYGRAAVSIIYRFFSHIGYPLVSFILIYGGYWFLKQVWEVSYKHLPGLYPVQYIYVVVPVYIVIWLGSVYLNGGFDSPFRSFKIVRGVFVGTLLISAVSNFFEDIRFSKALIILGSIWAVVALILVRYILHAIRYKNIQLEVSANRTAIIVGSVTEYERVMTLLRQAASTTEVIGYISPESSTSFEAHLLGGIDRIHELVSMYKPNEVIFCSKNVPASHIIQLMTQINRTDIAYKMVPDESNFVIGSNSKDTNGQLYTLEVHLALMDAPNLRNKRVLDVLTGVSMLLVGVLLVWFQSSGVRYLKNAFYLIFGIRTLVGYAGNQIAQLPKIAPGVLTTLSEHSDPQVDNITLQRLNLLYAKNYTTAIDIQILLSAWQKLGNR